MIDDDKQFLEFITGTLLPDMEQEGPSRTADDNKRLVRIIRHLSTDLRDAKKENASLARMVDGLQKLAEQPKQRNQKMKNVIAYLSALSVSEVPVDVATQLVQLLKEHPKADYSDKAQWKAYSDGLSSAIVDRKSYEAQQSELQELKALTPATVESPDPLGASQPCPEA